MIVFDWLEEQGVKDVLSMIYDIVDIIRIIVPIVLIVMTTIDIVKKIIDPNDKEGQKKIMIRSIAAVIIFFIPLLINILFKIMDIDIENINTKSNIPSSTPNTTIKPDTTIKPVPTVTLSPKLSYVNITNCPDKSIIYSPGDVIILNTDIPNEFNGEIEWIADRFDNNFIITPSSDRRSATLRVIDNPTTTFSTTTVVAGGKASACLIFVEKSH